jgi:hypothetical protein
MTRASGGPRNKLTRQQVLDGWLPDFLPAPDGSSLNRWLLRAVDAGQLCRDGMGPPHRPLPLLGGGSGGTLATRPLI